MRFRSPRHAGWRIHACYRECYQEKEPQVGVKLGRDLVMRFVLKLKMALRQK